MLRRDVRLNRQRDIKRVFQKGRHIYSDLFRVSWLPNKSDYPRVTVIIGLKFSKKATERNLIKRRVRHALANLIERLKPMDIILQPKGQDIKKFDYQTIVKNLESTAVKNHLLK